MGRMPITKILLSFGKIQRGSISMPYDEGVGDYRPVASVALNQKEVECILDLMKSHDTNGDAGMNPMIRRFEEIRDNMNHCIRAWQGV